MIKLKDIDLISDQKVSIEALCKIAGIKNTKVNKWMYRKRLHGVLSSLLDLSEINFKNIKPSNVGTYKGAELMSIPYICYVMMSTIRADKQSDYISQTLALYYWGNYYPDLSPAEKEREFLAFVEKVKEIDIIEALSVYNWVIQQLDRVGSYFNAEFSAVNIVDNDFDIANSGRLDKFANVEPVVKYVSEANCTMDEAWVKPFSEIMFMSLRLATRSYVEHRASEIKSKRNKRH